ncbi:hypothetical protein DFQ27_005994 [Actinomortierella ambigua]|uniref:tRNA(Phe) 7-[(3-amino-3-carboxypropyl)-4-demethylwyosine(37)-N(4)]-methyltransferase n=1 Tax=Actinomortierella ambigua TaxID=1343610 RepID=A0A9P6PX74_9FUNG|nr:hypothetical protein DFQ26_007801 [Actinomortierella ambigua]KAG0255937.1 hypothetical protein DFQ27_005994 [Actinomortierella ambigua]
MSGFQTRKKAILIALNSDTPDKSPKGYVDEPLLPLIILINNHADYVTTSSCSGRICTYLEGMDENVADGTDHTEGKDENGEDEEDEEDEDMRTEEGYAQNTSLAAVEASKRAKGGQWLYVSHDPVPMDQHLDNNEALDRWTIDTLFGPEASRVVTVDQDPAQGVQPPNLALSQLVYFKFEPMILHIEASSLPAAKTFLNYSLFSGYRNSGILPSAKRTMLAIRSTLKIDTPIAYVHRGTDRIQLMVTLPYLRGLLELSNDKFRMNVAQMQRFEQHLQHKLVGVDPTAPSKPKIGDQGTWEDKDARRERKRREGMERKRILEAQRLVAAATLAPSVAQEAELERLQQLDISEKEDVSEA